MSYSPLNYTGNGTETEYSISFGYLAASHIQVTVNSVIKTQDVDYTVNVNTNKVVFTTAPTSGHTIKIERITPIADTSRTVVFADGSNLNATSLNNSALQNLYISQELKNEISGLVLNPTVVDMQVANSFTAMRAITGTSGGENGLIYCHGSASVNDGYEGFFKWDGTLVAPDDGASVIKPTAINSVDPGRWVRTNPGYHGVTLANVLSAGMIPGTGLTSSQHTQNTAVFNELAHITGVGLFFPPDLTFEFEATGSSEQLLVVEPETPLIVATGSTLSQCRISIRSTADKFTWHGGHITNDGTSGGITFQVEADNVTLRDLEVTNGATSAIWTSQALGPVVNFQMHNCKINGSAPVTLQNVKNVIIDGLEMTSGSDDGIALKAQNSNVENVKISNVYAKGFASIVTAGTQIAENLKVKNVTITNCIGEDVEYGIYIKSWNNGSAVTTPGTDVPGIVEGWNVSNIQVDCASTFKSLVGIETKFGGIIQDCSFDNFNASVRKTHPASSTVFGNAVLVQALSGATTTEKGTLKRLKFNNFSIVDKYGAVANSGSAPGSPIVSTVVWNTDAAGTAPYMDIDDIMFTNFYVNGTSERAVWNNSGTHGEGNITWGDVRYENWYIKNAHIATSMSSNHIINTHATKVKNIEIDDWGWTDTEHRSAIRLSNTGAARKFKTMTVHIGDVAAGTAKFIPIPIAPAAMSVDVFNVTISTSAAVSANGTNYVTFKLARDGSLTGSVFNTSATAITAYEKTQIYDTTEFHLEHDQCFGVDISHAGSGAALDDLSITISYCEH